MIFLIFFLLFYDFLRFFVMFSDAFLIEEDQKNCHVCFILFVMKTAIIKKSIKASSWIPNHFKLFKIIQSKIIFCFIIIFTFTFTFKGIHLHIFLQVYMRDKVSQRQGLHLSQLEVQGQQFLLLFQ